MEMVGKISGVYTKYIWLSKRVKKTVVGKISELSLILSPHFWHIWLLGRYECQELLSVARPAPRSCRLLLSNLFTAQTLFLTKKQ
jgi:hypothetical protein